MDKQELQMAKKLGAGLRALNIVSDSASHIHVDWSDIKALQDGNDLAWASAAHADGEDGIIEAAKRAIVF